MNGEEIRHGPAVRVGSLEIRPLYRSHSQTLGSGCIATIEPVGILVIGENERYVLDLEGKRSAKLAAYGNIPIVS